MHKLITNYCMVCIYTCVVIASCIITTSAGITVICNNFWYERSTKGYPCICIIDSYVILSDALLYYMHNCMLTVPHWKRSTINYMAGTIGSISLSLLCFKIYLLFFPEFSPIILKVHPLIL